MWILIMCFMSSFIWADGTVNVTVDRHKINEGDSITLTVTAINVQNDPDVNLPKMQDFKIVSGPNQSSSTNVQFMNGKMTKSSTVTLTWTLIPLRIGQIIIPAIKRIVVFDTKKVFLRSLRNSISCLLMKSRCCPKTFQ